MRSFNAALIALAMLFCVSLSASAKEPVHAKEEKNSRAKIDEVIVSADVLNNISLDVKNDTGSRLGITALETPAMIQAISGDVIRLRGDIDIVTAVTRVAGITSNATAGSGGFGFAARGFGSASVTLLYDGTKSLINTGSLTYPYDTWNVERIDALNGPASVLYGGGAIGAAINIVPRKPSAAVENTIRVLSGSNDTWGVALDSTGPLSDNVQYRLDVSRNSSEGYVDRGDSDSTVVTGALAYEPTNNLKFTLSVDYADRQQMVYQGLPLINGDARESLRKINYASYDSDIPFEDHRVQLTTEWDVSENIAVRNLTSYMRGERLWRYPSRFIYQSTTNQIQVGGFGTFLQHQDQISNFTDLSWKHSLFGLENTLVVGAEIARLSNDRYVDNYSGFNTLDLYASNPGVFPTTISSRNYQESNIDQYSFFAEDRLSITDALSLVTGIRWDHSNLERNDLFINTTAEKTYIPISWRVGSIYELTTNFSLYAQYATAVDPVGNACCISAAQMDFAMSEGKQTEIGVKQIAWDGNFEWSLAVYRIVKDKLLTPDPVTIGQSVQVGQQSSRGVEATLALTLFKDWRINANATVLKAEYDDFSETANGSVVSRDGNRVINTPQRAANLWVTYTLTPNWLIQSGVRYVGDSYINADNSQRLSSFTVVDVGVHWDIDSKIGIDFRGKNIFDKFYAYTSVANGNNGGQWVLGAPRRFETALTVKF